MQSKTKKKTKNSQGPSWPYYKLFISKQTMNARIQEMRKLKFKISNQSRKPIALNLKTKTVPTTFKGKFITFVDDNYLKYDILPLVYSESELLKCQFRGKTAPINQYNEKAAEYWHEFQALSTKNSKPTKSYKITKKLSSAKSYSNTKLDENTLEAYREFLYSKIKACNNYRPTLAMQTYWFLGQAKSVLDFSAGWGDRLFAACVSQIKYIGLDPNINNRNVYDTIISNHGSQDQQRVITTGAEYFPNNLLKQNMEELGIRQFDLIATSPPYYDYEIYSDTAQSAMGFVDAPRWLIFWLGQVIYKYIPFLRPGGYLALYIQDTAQNSYVEPLALFIMSQPDKFTGLICCGLIHSTRFPMIVFQKPLTNNKPSSRTQMAIKNLQIFKSTYPVHTQIAQVWRRAHNYLKDINTNTLTRTVVKYLINQTGQKVHIPNSNEYNNLAQEFQVRLEPNTTPAQLDKLFMALWQESIEEYKLIHGKRPETNIQPSEYQEIYNKIFYSVK